MEHLRSSLTLYAYNILGSYEDAKDIVQDVFVKFGQLDESRIDDAKSYLIRMVVNLSIDRKRRLKKNLDHYPGPWLPEPIATDDPEILAHRKQILSYSLMVLLEKLDSKQRAVFILKEAFDYDHEEIAGLLAISVENSRKILSRAKGELQSGLNITPDESQMKMLHRYLRVMEAGDMRELESLLTRDIEASSDGGGKATASRHIIKGIQTVSALLQGLYKKIYSQSQTEIGWVNHQPAVFYFREGALVTCQIFIFQENQLQRVFTIRNPDKLKSFQKRAKNVVTFSPGHSS